jgi:hypothetical protein
MTRVRRDTPPSAGRRCRPRIELLEGRFLPSTFTVNRFGDGGNGRDLHGDLRYCLTQANQNPGEDLIIFQGQGTIHLKSPLPAITDDLIIAGPGADQLTIQRSSGGNYRIFTVAAGVQAQIFSLTVTNGFASGTTWGGGIFNAGTLTLGGVAVVGNRADCGSCSNARGGGILNGGTLTVADSTISGNVVHGSGAFGGGIENRPGATLTISNSTVAANTAEDDGTYDNVVQGGGIYTDASANLLIFNSTVAKNACNKSGSGSVASGGGIKGDVQLMRNTIVSKNLAQTGADISGNVWSGDHNFIGGDAKLGPLQNNGGPTQTLALLPGSLAIDAGDNTDAPEFDQREVGFARVVNGVIDIGAFEVQPTAGPTAPARTPGALGTALGRMPSRAAAQPASSGQSAVRTTDNDRPVLSEGPENPNTGTAATPRTVPTALRSAPAATLPEDGTGMPWFVIPVLV